MADEIKHGANNIVNSSSLITDVALANAYANNAGSVVANNTQMYTITIDKKGRITASGVTSINTTGVTYANTDADGAGSFAHLPNQKIHISSSAPDSNSVGNNGDIWYQTL